MFYGIDLFDDMTMITWKSIYADNFIDNVFVEHIILIFNSILYH